MFALWPGGWFEMSPHAGTPGLLDGRETMLHGEAARLPWQVLDSGPAHGGGGDRLRPRAVALRRPIELAGDGLLLRSWIENRGATPVEVCHGEHPVFARADFAAARIELQARRARVLEPPEPEAATVRRAS